MPWNDCEQDAGDDELLAVLGYKVKSSDMVDVAEKLQHLEEAMGQAQQQGISQLGSETVHYNPSDRSLIRSRSVRTVRGFPRPRQFHPRQLICTG